MAFGLPQIRLPQFSKRTWLIIGGGAAALLLLIILIVSAIPKGKVAEKVALSVWMSTESLDQMTPVLQSFLAQNTSVEKINFKQIAADNYENELLNALAADKGPDIFVLPNDLLTRHLDKISPMPATLLTPDLFRSTFVPVAADDAIRKDTAGSEYIMGVPFNMDTLGLFYNTAMFSDANLEAPQTWDDFASAVAKLTNKQQDGSVVRVAGAALGGQSNVSFATDILYLLMLQNGTKMVSADKTSATFHLSEAGTGGNPVFPGTDALSFYTGFAIPGSTINVSGKQTDIYTWNNTLPSSFQALSRRKAAMIFGYASNIEDLSKLSGIKLGVAPVPQPAPELVGTTLQEKTVNYAQYQIMTVSRKSSSTDAAWELINYLTSKDAQKMINASTKRLSARLDLIEEQSKISLYGTFVSEFSTAQNWYKKDPAKMDKIFEQAIDAVVLFGQSPQNALESAAQSANKILGEQ